MERPNIPLQHVTDIIAMCIVLCNMCTTGKEVFDMKWIEKKNEIEKINKNK